MTMEQFVRNNTNYGVDVKQTRPIPRSYLEDIYTSISECPLKTERNDLLGVLTTEMMTDMMLLSSVYPNHGIMPATGFTPDVLQLFSSSLYESCGVASQGGDRTISDLFCFDASSNLFVIAEGIHGREGVINIDFWGCVGKEMVLTVMIPFLDGVRGSATLTSLRFSADTMLSFLVLCDLVKDHTAVDAVVCILTALTGLFATSIDKNIESIVRALFPASIPPEIFDSWRFTVIEQSSPLSDEGIADDLIESLTRRAALGTVLQVVRRYPDLLKNSWVIVWHAFSALRDRTWLPFSMVQETEPDALPVAIRQEFEGRLLAFYKKSSKTTMEKSLGKKSSSILSLQSLGEAFFGASQEAVDADAAQASQRQSFNSASSRWDCGYDAVKLMGDDSLTGKGPDEDRGPADLIRYIL